MIPPVDIYPSSIECILEAVLADGGLAMILAEAHFDESVGSAGGKIICVAGYVFDIHQAKKMRKAWNSVLEQENLAYFRMSECAHGNEQFRKYRDDKSKRDRIARKMISIIKKRALFGVAASVYEKEYIEFVPKMRWVGSPYSILTRAVMGGAIKHFGERQCKIIYFYEAGDKSQREANSIMRGIMLDEQQKKEHHYNGHAFVDKKGNPGIQAADLLAWQWYTDRRHQIENRPRRKDLESLMTGMPYYAIHLGSVELIDMVAGVREAAQKAGLTTDDVGLM